MKAIEVRNVQKSFGKLAVLKGINLEVAQGEIFTLLGENGAGKSTLINILTTLSKADHGDVKIMGLDPQKQGDQIRQQISLNAQTMTIDEEFTGLENLKLIIGLRAIANPTETINTLANRLELSSFLNRKVKTYSGGMKRRLDIAMSLIGDPQMIFLDEPTTGVDPKNRLALWNMIKELRDAGKTVFLTTQYLDEADALSDHIAFIRDGKIVKYGTPAEIKQKVTDQYTIAVDETQDDQAKAILTDAQIEFSYQNGEFKVNKDAEKGLSVLINHQISIQHFNLDEVDLETVFLNMTGDEKEKQYAIN